MHTARARYAVVVASLPGLFVMLSALAASETKPATPSAAERMQQPGPEEQQLTRRTGVWAVKATFRPTPDAAPIITDESLAFVGLGKDVEGRMIRSNLEITRESADHEFVRQHWVQADGTARQWLAVEYEYKRRR